MDDTGRSRRTGAFAAALAGTGTSPWRGPRRPRPDHVRERGQRAPTPVRSQRDAPSRAATPTPRRAYPAIQNGANSGGHVIYATGNGMARGRAQHAERGRHRRPHRDGHLPAQPDRRRRAVPDRDGRHRDPLHLPQFDLRRLHGAPVRLGLEGQRQPSPGPPRPTRQVPARPAATPSPSRPSARRRRASRATGPSRSTSPTPRRGRRSAARTRPPARRSCRSPTTPPPARAPATVTWSLPSAPAWLSMNGSGRSRAPRRPGPRAPPPPSPSAGPTRAEPSPTGSSR